MKSADTLRGVTKAEVEQMALDAVEQYLKLDPDDILVNFAGDKSGTNARYNFFRQRAILAARVLDALKSDAH